MCITSLYLIGALSQTGLISKSQVYGPRLMMALRAGVNTITQLTESYTITRDDIITQANTITHAKHYNIGTFGKETLIWTNCLMIVTKQFQTLN